MNKKKTLVIAKLLLYITLDVYAREIDIKHHSSLRYIINLSFFIGINLLTTHLIIGICYMSCFDKLIFILIFDV